MRSWVSFVLYIHFDSMKSHLNTMWEGAEGNAFMFDFVESLNDLVNNSRQNRPNQAGSDTLLFPFHFEMNGYMVFNHQTSFFPRAMIIKITLGKSLYIVFFIWTCLICSLLPKFDLFFFFVPLFITESHISTHTIFRDTHTFGSQCQTLTLIVIVSLFDRVISKEKKQMNCQSCRKNSIF